MAETQALCERLEWDSAFFGLSIARARVDRLDASKAAAILDWCRTQDIDCLYFLAAAGDEQTGELLRESGFHAVDERVTLSRIVDSTVPTTDARLALPADIPALRDIAAAAHRDSRFYADARFSRGRCDELYRTWIERSCDGWADAVLVADRKSAPAGYLTIHVRSPRDASIGLLAVSADCQRQGVGTALIAGALAWACARSIERMSVVTQGRNATSLSFYRSAGFHPDQTATWYHRWFSRETPITG